MTKIKVEDIETAVNEWHPDQNINLYDSLTGEYHSSGTVSSIDLNAMDYDLAEPVDDCGQPTQPRLKN